VKPTISDILADALLACQLLIDLENITQNDCTYCGDKHNEEDMGCPIALAQRAIEMARVKGVWK
jgi:hypothetical protein